MYKMVNEDLIINSLGVKNFRSFDSDGIFLKGLNKINLLIGKNNSGKSNILKFLKILADLKGAWGSYPNNLENRHNKNESPASIFSHFSFDDLKFPTVFNYKDTRHFSKHRKMIEFLLDDTQLELNFGQEKININLKPNDSDSEFNFHKREIGVAIFNHLKINLGYTDPWEALKVHYGKFYKKHLQELFDRIIYIPDIRIIKEKNNIERSNSLINGANLTSELAYMKNHEIGEEDRFSKLKSIEAKIAEILNVHKIEINIPKKSEQFVLVVDDKRLLLENFGTGVHDLVMLCCILMLNKKSLVCIEEPEIHLHPELQRRFIKFLQETPHQYLITTHSNIFLDSYNENTSIYHVKYDGVKSYINKSISNTNLLEIVDELGYKASDLLQTNGIIWVEGPSDRTYLNAWISLVDPEIKEGIHYTIMFYGGKLLSHLSFEFEDQKELIQMMKINSNSFILIDRDVAPINKTKERVKEEIGISNCWITKGREIENYISITIVNKWLKTKDLSEIKTNINNKFEKEIKKYNPSFKYEDRKSTYAKELTEHFSKPDLEYSDLKKNLTSLIGIIKKWNKAEE